ncbi:MAG TPA: cyclic nucleotide-binding domain-containing protein [Actinomycetota bacterium]
MADKVIELLGGVPLFSELTRKELRAIVSAAKEVTHKEGDVLAREGDRGIGFFVIAEGSAKVTIGGRGRGKLGPGDFFGEISLLDEGPRSASVVAESPMRLYGLTAWNFRQMVSQNPAIAQKLLKVMAGRLRKSSKDLTH